MPAAFGYRTIWITLRAVNYTLYAFSQTIRSVQMLQASEEQAALATIKHGQYALMGGIMYITLASQMQEAASQMMAQSRLLGPLQKGFGDFFNTISQIEPLRDLIAILLMLGAAILYLWGAIEVLKGLREIIGVFKAWHTTSQIVTLDQWSGATATTAHAISWQLLAISISAALLSFAIFYEIFSKLPTWSVAIITAILAITAALWALYVAESAATWGIAAIFGGAAAAGAAVLAQRYMGGNFQMGTRMLEHTGPIWGHKGEVVYNPATNRPTQVGNDLAGEGLGPATVIYEMPMNIEQLHTKADKDELDRYMRKSLRRAARGRR